MSHDHVRFAEPPWPILREEAYSGLAGDVVRAIEPHSEADRAAILIQFLTCAGNLIGNSPYYPVESDRHHTNLFAVLVGNTAKARKGTSFGRVSAIVKLADEQWHADRVKGGLSSGEGLINEVRDEAKKWNAQEQSEEIVDAGIKDKRLLVTEPEFAAALVVADRHGNTLSPVIRKAWDGGKLSTMTKNSPLTATGAHISIIGHITIEELRARLTRTDMASGFANRFLFALVQRSKELPFGGDALSDDVIEELGRRLKRAAEVASSVGRVGWSFDAADMWRGIYSGLSAPRDGLLGAATSRAEAQVVRLALVYTLLHGDIIIGLSDLRAALAVWEFSEGSATFIFGNSIGDPIADDILRALRQAGEEGMTRTAIRDLFGRNRLADRIGAALAMLMTRGLVRAEMKSSGGRPTEVWFATDGRHHG
jgi:hypothetical protein